MTCTLDTNIAVHKAARVKIRLQGHVVGRLTVQNKWPHCNVAKPPFDPKAPKHTEQSALAASGVLATADGGSSEACSIRVRCLASPPFLLSRERGRKKNLSADRLLFRSKFYFTPSKGGPTGKRQRQ